MAVARPSIRKRMNQRAQNTHRVVLLSGPGQDNPINVQIDNLIITGGDTQEQGGGIKAQSADLILTNSTLEYNRGYEGGGVWSDGVSSLVNSEISSNSTVFYRATGPYTPYGGTGGGIFNIGEITINNTIIAANSAYSGGGGIWSKGQLSVSSSDIISNFTSVGQGPYSYGDIAGGIYSGGLAYINNSSIKNNLSMLDGGGIFNSGIIYIDESSVESNRSDYRFNGIKWRRSIQ